MRKTHTGKFKITSTYGEKRSGGRVHGGLDIVGLTNKKVYSPVKMKIVRIGWENPSNHKQGYGFRIWAQILSGQYKGKSIVFGHLKANSNKYKVGDTVNRNVHIATEGNTGSSTGSHLHIEIRNIVGGSARYNIAYFLGLPNKIGNHKFTNVYKSGDKGDEIEAMQKRLNALKFGNLVVDGIYGINTARAVNKGKKKYKWKQDSKAGKRFRKKIGAWTV